MVVIYKVVKHNMLYLSLPSNSLKAEELFCKETFCINVNFFEKTLLNLRCPKAGVTAVVIQIKIIMLEIAFKGLFFSSLANETLVNYIQLWTPGKYFENMTIQYELLSEKQELQTN